MKTEVQTTAASKVKGAALIVGVYEGKTAKTVTWTAVIIMIVLVQVVQGIANAIAKRLLKRQQ